MSYRKLHIKSKLRGARLRKSIFRRRWFWFTILILAILFSLMYFAFFYPGLQVKNILISGNQKVPALELQKFLITGANKKIIEWGPVKIFSKSIFLIDKIVLTTGLLKNFPAIEKITIKTKFPQTLSVSVKERNPVGIYCSAGNKCFFIDAAGIIFSAWEGENPEGMFIVRQALQDKDVFAGENVIDGNIVNFILKIEKNLRDNFNINLKEALVATSIRLDAETNENWQIYFNTGEDGDINMQLTKLNLLLNGDITPEIRKTLQYIDLRFKDRAYYK